MIHCRGYESPLCIMLQEGIAGEQPGNKVITQFIKESLWLVKGKGAHNHEKIKGLPYTLLGIIKYY